MKNSFDVMDNVGLKGVVEDVSVLNCSDGDMTLYRVYFPSHDISLTVAAEDICYVDLPMYIDRLDTLSKENEKLRKKIRELEQREAENCRNKIEELDEKIEKLKREAERQATCSTVSIGAASPFWYLDGSVIR